MSASLDFLEPTLQTVFRRLQGWYASKYPNRSMELTHSRRTAVEQLYLFVQGRLPNYPGAIVTWKDGFVNKSKHNFDPSRAFDFGIKIDGKFAWHDGIGVHLGKVIPQALLELGYGKEIRYGGEFNDFFHIELR